MEGNEDGKLPVRYGIFRSSDCYSASAVDVSAAVVLASGSQ